MAFVAVKEAPEYRITIGESPEVTRAVYLTRGEVVALRDNLTKILEGAK